MQILVDKWSETLLGGEQNDGVPADASLRLERGAQIASARAPCRQTPICGSFSPCGSSCRMSSMFVLQIARYLENPLPTDSSLCTTSLTTRLSMWRPTRGKTRCCQFPSWKHSKKRSNRDTSYEATSWSRTLRQMDGCNRMQPASAAFWFGVVFSMLATSLIQFFWSRKHRNREKKWRTYGSNYRKTVCKCFLSSFAGVDGSSGRHQVDSIRL